MLSLKGDLVSYAKNMLGWRTDRKILVISVDDYGNVRLNSKRAKNAMHAAGLKSQSIFDEYDALETSDDLHDLYDTLTSVKDRNGRHAVFTPFAIPCNIDFEKLRETGNKTYVYELLPQTFAKLEGYENTWALWQEGIRMGMLVPQFHGREHLNLKVFSEKLRAKDHELMTALQHRSYSCISGSGYTSISYTAAFDFWDFEENEVFHGVVDDGLRAFETVFGYRATHFNPPGGREHPVIHPTLRKHGVLYLDTPFVKIEHHGHGKFRRVINFMGKKNKNEQTYLIRNVVFEPVFEQGIDWVSHSLKQIEIAFRMKKPAVISSHRVNFCGHIDEKNRKMGINALRSLLRKVVDRWPDVEFMAVNELAGLISGQQRQSTI